MIDPQLVETPKLFPAWCVGCQSQKGPIFDLGVDLAAPGPNGTQHIYLCRRCARAAAKAYGFAKGEKMDELEAASDRLLDAEKAAEKTSESARKLSEQLTLEQQEHIVTKAELERLREQEHERMFRLQQIIALGNELVVGANGG